MEVSNGVHIRHAPSSGLGLLSADRSSPILNTIQAGEDDHSTWTPEQSYKLRSFRPLRPHQLCSMRIYRLASLAWEFNPATKERRKPSTYMPARSGNPQT